VDPSALGWTRSSWAHGWWVQLQTRRLTIKHPAQFDVTCLPFGSYGGASAWFRDEGFRVLRFPNQMIENHREKVLAAIVAATREGLMGD